MTDQKKAATVLNWLADTESRHGLNRALLPPTLNQRLSIPCESVDGVFCLGQHSIVFDNSPINIISDTTRVADTKYKRWFTQDPKGNLLLLFLLLTQASANVTGQWADLLTYVKSVQFQQRGFAT